MKSKRNRISCHHLHPGGWYKTIHNAPRSLATASQFLESAECQYHRRRGTQIHAQSLALGLNVFVGVSLALTFPVATVSRHVRAASTNRCLTRPLIVLQKNQH